MSDTPAHSEAVSTPVDATDSAILRLLMQTIPDRIYFKDDQSRFVRVNWSHAKWLGVPTPADAVGKTDFDFFSNAHATAAFSEEQEIMRTGEPLVGEIELITKQDGSAAWGSTTKMPWRDAAGRIIGTFGLTRDVTATKRAEEKVTEEHNLLRTIIDHLPSRVFVKDKEARYLINNRAHLRSLGVSRQEDAKGRTALAFYSGPRAEQTMEDDRKVLAGEPPIISQEKSNFGPEGDCRWALTTKVPLRDVHGAVTGLVGISHDITQRKRAEQELQRRSAEMEADLRMARQVQEAFFSRNYPVFPRTAAPEASALKFAYRYVAATTLGGDFFDVIQLSDHRCGVLVCDVMGHGVRAGLLTALIRGVVGELGERADDPAYVLAEINRGLLPILHQTGQLVFASAFFGVIDLAAGTLVYSSAGHPPPFVLHRAPAAVDELALANPEPAAGIVEDFSYSRHTCDFGPGSVLIGYTDGLIEACNATDCMFGEQKVRALLLENSALSGPLLLDRLMADVKAFTGKGDFDDDLCLLAVESFPAADASAR